MKKRKAGLLLPIASLPGGHGIGDLGPAAYQFIRYCKATGIRIWQILPIHPLGYGNSPYQPFSCYAGEAMYISLELLKTDGLLKKCPAMEYDHPIAYEQVRNLKERYLQTAYQAFQKQFHTYQKEYEEFCQKAFWLHDYTLFMAVKKVNDQKPWITWSDADKHLYQEASLPSHLLKEMDYQTFLQFIFFRQWQALKNFAHTHEVEIMGDMPIYVGLDSADVWANPGSFKLDEQGNPIWVAGVPPDYFSEDGQRWGNPIYNWEYMKEQRYSFWIDRLRWSMGLYDAIRIDHFRGFDSYWQIPANSETAKLGEWIDGPGGALFDEIYRQLPHIQIVAEDLGDLRPSVLELRDHYQLRGMLVMQFLLENLDQLKTETDIQHALIYTGTHDNPTLLSWLESQSKKALDNLKDYFGITKPEPQKLADAIIQYTLCAEPDLAILPVQDILYLDDMGRINTPSTIGSPNWEWRLSDMKQLDKQQPILKMWLRTANRI